MMIAHPGVAPFLFLNLQAINNVIGTIRRAFRFASENITKIERRSTVTYP